MLENLKLLLPGLNLFENTSDTVSDWFVWITVVFFVVFLAAVRRSFVKAKGNLSAIQSLLVNVEQEALSENRREIRQKAAQLKNKTIGKIWNEFDETLVQTLDDKRLYNTYDAEHFFNSETLSAGLSGSRFLASTPSFLVAVGVLGTFVGLTMGLSGLGGGVDDVEALTAGVNSLISGATVAFKTSVWGVLLSLVLSLVEKGTEGKILKDIRLLQNQIDFLFPRISAEQSLANLSEYGRESKEALQELHERIGNKLQESVSQISVDMQQAVVDALQSVMGPAMNSLVERTSEQSTDTLEKLISSFMDGVQSAGQEQGQALNSAASSVSTAVGMMNEKLTSLTASFDEQQQAIASNAQQQAEVVEEHVQKIANQFTARSEELESKFTLILDKVASEMSSQQQQAEKREEERREALANSIDSVTTKNEALLSRIAEAAMMSQEQSSAMFRQHQELLAQLTAVTEGITQSGVAMATSATQLGVLGANLEGASRHLNAGMASTVEVISEINERSTSLVSVLEAYVREANEMQVAQRNNTEAFTEVAEQVTTSFKSLSKEQEQFLEDLGEQAVTLAEKLREKADEVHKVLREEVEGVREQSEKWLREYSGQVSGQIESIMQSWNKQTLGFAQGMERVVQTLNHVVDEIEVRS